MTKLDCKELHTTAGKQLRPFLQIFLERDTAKMSLSKGCQGAGRMLFSRGSKRKIKKGAGRLNLVRDHENSKNRKGASKKKKKKRSREDGKK